VTNGALDKPNFLTISFKILLRQNISGNETIDWHSFSLSKQLSGPVMKRFLGNKTFEDDEF